MSGIPIEYNLNKHDGRSLPLRNFFPKSDGGVHSERFHAAPRRPQHEQNNGVAPRGEGEV